ncbi:MAG: glycoside hydrolase family 28 protein [Verrucomicrobiales bacterium]|nr:glycoside hydrolase family 28 protein [Verrucomicrobiales bacterium]
MKTVVWIMFLGGAWAACTPAGETLQSTDSAARPPREFNVREFGAKGDGTTLDTIAIQRALDECGKAGGGVVRVPPGKYLIGPISLRSHTTLWLESGAVLQATTNHQAYMKEPGDWRTAKSSADFVPLISGTRLTNVAIAGKGTIDGAGEVWWGPAEEARRKTPGYTLPRPRLIILTGCKQVRITGVTLQNSPSFHLVPTDCEDVWIEGLTIVAPDSSPNTDGIDPSVSRRVVITNCVIDVGDDNVAIKSGRKLPGREFACEDIIVTDCVFRHGHGMSIGSETVGGIRNVLVKNCVLEGTENGLRIKTARGRGGRIENITYTNITLKGCRPYAITITCYYPRIPETDTAQPVTPETPKISGVRIMNVRGSGTRAVGVIVGLPESAVEDVVLEDVELAGPRGLTVRHAKNVRLKAVRLSVEQGEELLTRDAEVVRMQ